MTRADAIPEVITVGLDRWRGGWMNRRYLAVAMNRLADVTYVVHPTYPARLRDLGFLPHRRREGEVDVWTLPRWMGPDFARTHGLGRLSRAVQRRLVFRAAKERTRGLLLWHPLLADYLDTIPADVTAFYVDDLFEGLARGEAQRTAIRRRQDVLLERCDVLFVTWRGLAEHLGVADRAVILPHGVDFDQFAPDGAGAAPPPEDMPTDRPVAGYIGTLNEKVDMALLEKLARALPDWNVVILGNKVLGTEALRRRCEALLARPNVVHLGVKQPEALAACLHAFDVCLMCYAVTDWTHYVLPLKMLQYFATGKPVVSTSLPALEEYEAYFDVCPTDEAFVEAVAGARDGDDPDRRAARIAFARANTWDRRAETVLASMAAAARGQSPADAAADPKEMTRGS